MRESIGNARPARRRTGPPLAAAVSLKPGFRALFGNRRRSAPSARRARRNAARAAAARSARRADACHKGRRRNRRDGPRAADPCRRPSAAGRDWRRRHATRVAAVRRCRRGPHRRRAPAADNRRERYWRSGSRCVRPSLSPTLDAAVDLPGPAEQRRRLARAAGDEMLADLGRGIDHAAGSPRPERRRAPRSRAARLRRATARHCRAACCRRRNRSRPRHALMPSPSTSTSATKSSALFCAKARSKCSVNSRSTPSALELARLGAERRQAEGRRRPAGKRSRGCGSKVSTRERRAEARAPALAPRRARPDGRDARRRNCRSRPRRRARITARARCGRKTRISFAAQHQDGGLAVDHHRVADRHCVFSTTRFFSARTSATVITVSTLSPGRTGALKDSDWDEIDRARTGQFRGDRGRDEAGAEHAMRDPALEHRGVGDRRRRDGPDCGRPRRRRRPRYRRPSRCRS